VSTSTYRVVTALALSVAVALGAVARSGATFRGPNGLIAFSQQVGKHRQLFTIRPDGTELTQITRLKGDASNPAWSPDGERIAFDADLGNRASVYTIRFDGRDLREVTPRGLSWLRQLTPWRLDAAIKHDWRPDGKLIVFSSYGEPHPTSSPCVRTAGA
jgi:Tol biopolymer transport system component